MNKLFRRKLHSERGLSRLVAILLALTLVMLVVVGIPVYRHYKAIADEIGCMAALDTAWRQTAVDYLANNQNPTAQEVKDVVTYAMDGWDDLCPGGGTVYVVETDESDTTGLPYKLVCGIHGDDAKERTRLNAGYALELLGDALHAERLQGNETPDSLTVTLNGKELKAERLEEANGLRRGTSATLGYEGTVAYFTLDAAGAVNWFVYADKDHAAVWRDINGWTGDSYSN